ncbi:MAG: glyceraldehyde-3-phosphate dehydrogenase [Alteromonadaceae bacterium]|nr:glyceraldehyde-3-phosphate dehydrogenase [Alteromonadaceae bacterium]
MSHEQINQHLSNWTDRESTAEAMIPLIGRLNRKNNVVTSVYGRAIINQSVIDIIRAHRFVRQVEDSELSVHDTLPILEAMDKLELGRGHVDIGKLAVKFKESGVSDLTEFLKQEIGPIVGQYKAECADQDVRDTKDVVLYGFGRIGRLLARILIEKAGGGANLRLRAIVVRKGKADNDLQKRASLLRRDSVHGPFDGTITVDEEDSALIANGNYIKVIYSDGPDQVDYTQYDINNAIVIDNTGIWRDEDGLGLHLKSKGVSRVILTAPGKGDIKNIVYGINSDSITDDDKILYAASCTPTATTPEPKAIHDQYGIENGHVETVPSYTNDQTLTEHSHKGTRRGRSAPLNMVITETGAAKAGAKALPELKGKLSGNAIRVPTPNVSMAILNLNLKKDVDVDMVNDYLRDMALHSELQKQIDFVNSPEVVSTDFVGSRHAGVVDAQATIAEGNRLILYVWYDNEFGYSAQVIRCVNDMAGIDHPIFPKRVRD